MSDRHESAEQTAPVHVSVIIPVRNGAQTLADQLEALRTQEGIDFPWEVIVSDNGSTDVTVDVVAHASRSFPVPLRVVDSSTRPGVSTARNTGALASHGDILAFCDHDDVVAPGWVAAASAGCDQFWAVSGMQLKRTTPLSSDAPVIVPLYSRGGLQGCNLAVRRKALFAVGGFDEAFPPYGAEDSEFTIRLQLAGFTTGPAPGMVLYFQETTSLPAKVRKIYSSGLAATVMWRRHPDYFPDQLSGRALMAEFLAIPGHYVRAWKSTPRSFNSAVRRTILPFAHTIGRFSIARPGRVPPPRYIPSDPRATTL